MKTEMSEFKPGMEGRDVSVKDKVISVAIVADSLEQAMDHIPEGVDARSYLLNIIESRMEDFDRQMLDELIRD